MTLLDRVKEKAVRLNKKVVLPEGTESRTLKAAQIATEKKIARITLLGDQKQVNDSAKALGVNLNGIEVIDPKQADCLQDYINEYYLLRKHKGVDLEKAKELMMDPLFFASMMVRNGAADGEVAGALNSTGDVLRPALQIVRTAPGISTVSGSFIMIVPNCTYGSEGLFVFADCAVIPNPNAEQLVDIAVSSAETAAVLCDLTPVIGMLSFSTKGSASHELVDKVKSATKMLKEKYPDLAVEGELQADAAIVPEVGATKSPSSSVAGKCNVLVFPDLQAGNISYKLVERLAKATAIGPILQGMARPVTDLSRGCNVDDIVNAIAMTAVRAK
jgi:phosphate acetyltransferase